MSLPGLRHARDVQSLAYLVAQPMLAFWQWRYGFSWWAFPTMLVLAVGIGVVHHNHAHLPMWRTRWMNRATDLWLTLVQGHPTWMFLPAHNGNHHRFRGGPRDLTRTARFGGDHNHLAGYVLHPMHAVRILYPMLYRWWRSRSPRQRRWYALQHALWLASWAGLLLLDPAKASLYVILPQLVGLHWLLGANYLQHAHTDAGSRWNHARNFTGPIVNAAWFNIGYHTAHHAWPRAHWSTLPALHAEVRHHIDPRLQERNLLRYLARVFVAGIWSPRAASQPWHASGQDG